jgi:hypothetical protein
MSMEFTRTQIAQCRRNCTTVLQHKHSRVIRLKGTREVGKLTSGERGCLITIIICMNAVAFYIPPTMIWMGHQQVHFLLVTLSGEVQKTFLPFCEICQLHAFTSVYNANLFKISPQFKIRLKSQSTATCFDLTWTSTGNCSLLETATLH